MIFNMVGGGGGSGATLVVSSPVNVSVTVSKDDKSYTKNSGSLGSTTFKGLATGTWTITISGNGQTATRTIEITADYAITIAFFSATINITYPANSTCVVTNSSGQTVASDTNTTSSDKTWVATVNATGTYTITATATDGSGNTKSESVEITSEGQSVSVELSYTPKGALYWVGDEVSNITGGWLSKTKYDGNVTFGESSVTITCPQSASAVMVTNNSVDMTEYSYIVLQLESAPTTSGEYQFSVLSQNVSVTSYDDMVYRTKAHVVVVPSALDSGLSIKLDISSVNDGYVAFGGADSIAQTMVVKSITMI